MSLRIKKLLFLKVLIALPIVFGIRVRVLVGYNVEK